MDLRWKHPFTAFIVGPTGSGKTVFVHKVLAHLPDMIDPTPEEIIWCYGEWQSMYENMKGVQFSERHPDMEQWP
jgi:ABC-type glutathione transport system ATPase component